MGVSKNYLNRIYSSSSKVFIFLFIITLIARFFTLFPLVIDHDESTYLVIANEWLKGFIPFKDYIDIKPVGIYGIYALATGVFGQSIIAIRLLTIAAISTSAFFLFKAGRAAGKSNFTSLSSGLLYISLISVDQWGWPGNTEIFFNLFTAAALFFLVKQKKSTAHYFVIGFLMGIGFILKYHVAFDFLAFLLLIVWVNKSSFKNLIFRISITGVSFLIPFGLVNLYYYFSGNYTEFIDVSFIIPSRYSSSVNVLDSGLFVVQFYLFFLPLSIFYFMGIYKRIRLGQDKTKEAILSILWPFLVWIAVLFTGKLFPHYYAQALIPFSFFALDHLESLNVKKRSYSHFRKGAVSILGILFLVGIMSQFFSLIMKPDNEKAVLEYLTEHIKPEDKFYSQKMVLHYMLDKSPQTKYIHPTIFSNKEHIEAFRINLEDEYDSIRESNSKYIYCYTNGGSMLRKMIQEEYKLVLTSPDKYSLWQKKEE